MGTAETVCHSVATLRDESLAGKIACEGVALLDDGLGRDWGVAKVHATLEALLEDPEIDAVHNALPVSIRCEWSMRALKAGKHVLSEPPLGASAREAVMLQRAAEDCGRVLVESNNPCDPVGQRLREMVRERAIGRLTHIEMSLPGVESMKTLGCRCVSFMRCLTSEEPRVVQARTRVPEGGTSHALGCDLTFPSGATGRIHCSLLPGRATLRVLGEEGRLTSKEWVFGAASSHLIETERFHVDGDRVREWVRNDGQKGYLHFQLLAFAQEVEEQGLQAEMGMPWSYSSSGICPGWSVKNAAVVDSIYQAAGLEGEEAQAPSQTVAAKL